MNRFASAVLYWISSFLLALIDGFLGWFLLDSTFHLGFWVWAFIAFFVIHACRAAAVLGDSYGVLTRKRKSAKI